MSMIITIKMGEGGMYLVTLKNRVKFDLKNTYNAKDVEQIRVGISTGLFPDM